MIAKTLACSQCGRLVYKGSTGREQPIIVGFLESAVVLCPQCDSAIKRNPVSRMHLRYFTENRQ